MITLSPGINGIDKDCPTRLKDLLKIFIPSTNDFSVNPPARLINVLRDSPSFKTG